MNRKKGRPPIPEEEKKAKIKEPTEPQPKGRKPKQDPISYTKEYYKNYYHEKLVKPHQCEICKGTFCSRITLLKHQKKNKKLYHYKFD